MLFGTDALYARAGVAPVPNEVILTEMEGVRTKRVHRGVEPPLKVAALGSARWDPAPSLDLGGWPF